ncbi:MAG TPA: hypothetical protein V6C76_11590 [Drouetiella sp.]
MTNRLTGVFVAFEREIRDDDAEAIVEAIKMVRGVAGVTKKISEAVDFAAERRIEERLREKFWQFYKENFGKL